jgi:mannose-6-phosphate isomerase
LIDTARPLSIQLHPDDEFHPGRPGKEEAWVILDAADDASLLAGLRDEVTRQDLRRALDRAHADPNDDAPLFASLRRVEVHAGMCIVIPAGTVHAIGPGILLMEIQQPVDCTFRLYDYGSGRPLHPEDAMAALHERAQPRIWSPEDPPEPVGGRHVQLQPHRGSGSGARGPKGVVVVQGDATVSARGDSEHLEAGDLVLARGAATIEASPQTLWVEAGLGPRAGSRAGPGP